MKNKSTEAQKKKCLSELTVKNFTILRIEKTVFQYQS
jgi:hypothetical protein